MSATPPDLLEHLVAAARPLGLVVEVGPDHALDGALAGWVYTGNASGTPAGRLDVAEVRLSPAGHVRTRLVLTRVDLPVPSRFEKQWSLHEVRFKAPLLWGRLAATVRRRLAAAGLI